MKKNIAICGSTCVGKTTLIEKLRSYYLDVSVIKESPQNNPFFDNCFETGKGSMFKSQLMFYSEYLKNLAACIEENREYMLFDRFIDEYQFLSNFRYSIGEISDSELFICNSLAEGIKFFSPPIHKIIYLHCSLSTAIERKRKRAKKWDRVINENLMESLMQSYDEWYYRVVETHNIETISINTDYPIPFEEIISFLDK